ncbi:MAG: LysR family transcriptional regulator [Bacteriovorax sp.]|nr:LysR family transcriptional regulator [Bacteriovorax sp.]
MPISSIQLEAFFTLTQTLNFTKAAAKLHVTQSALSQRIINLEEELQVTLFIRNRAGLKLTESALELFRYCQSKNNLEEEVVAKLKSKNSKELVGSIRIGTFSSIMRSILLPSVSNLVRQNPGLKLQLITKEVHELPVALKHGEVDYMILDHRLDKEELERIPLGFEHNVLIKKKNYRGPEIYLDHDENDLITSEYFKLAKRKIKKLERRFVGDVYGLLAGVTHELGMAVIPKHIIKGIKDIEVIEPQVILKIPVALYFYKQSFYSSLHSVIIEEITNNFKKKLDQN